MRRLRILAVATSVGAVIAGGTGAAYGQPWANIPSGTTGVTVHAGATTHNINASISKGAALAGKITASSNGAPLGSVYVQVFARNGAYAGGTVTMSDGTFSVVSLPASSTGFYVCANGDNAYGGPSSYGYVHRCYGSSATWVSTPPSSARKVPTAIGVVRSGINIALPAAGAIAGKITASSGSTAVSRVVVDVFATSGKIVASTYTFQSTYRIASVPAGAYKVCFAASQAAGGPSTTGYLSQCWKKRSWSGIGAPPSTAAVVHVVAAHQAGGINAALSPAGAIAGTVRTSASTHKALNGSFVNVFRGNTPVGYAATNKAGNYKVIGLGSGSYTVCAIGGSLAGSSTVYPKGRCWKGVAWTAGKPSSKATAVKVVAGKTHTGINLQLTGVANPVGAIAGTVKSSSGKALRNVIVTVYSGSSSIASATTATNGTYKVTHLKPSSTGYAVCFRGGEARPSSGSAPATGYAGVCYRQLAWDGGTLPAHPVKVGVKAGKTHAGINAVLGTAGAISGTVKYGSTPLSYLGVLVLNSHREYIASGYTDSNGLYTVKGLTPGTGYITCFSARVAYAAASPTGYRSQCYKQRVWNDDGYSA